MPVKTVAGHLTPTPAAPTPAARHPVETHPSRRQMTWCLRGASLLITLALWEWYGRSTNPILFTYPTAIAHAAMDMLADGTLPSALGQSLCVLPPDLPWARWSGSESACSAVGVNWSHVCSISPSRLSMHAVCRTGPHLSCSGSALAPLRKSWSYCFSRSFRCSSTRSVVSARSILSPGRGGTRVLFCGIPTVDRSDPAVWRCRSS